MCGIAGIVSQEKIHVSANRMAPGIHCLSHRGPDHESIWVSREQEAALGHRRLSIIDLSDRASQPMQYMDRYTIIHNGEIYNYLELKKELQQKGYSFSTESDTEVMVAAYDAWKYECLQRFDGMFSFAIWDEQEKKLFAARDRMGEKPFFFFYDEVQLVFASELKALWKMGIAKEVNRAMLYNFLTINYTSNPGNPQETFYANIHKLPASSYLVYQLPERNLEVIKYWQVDPSMQIDISTEAATEQFGEMFSSSVRKRLRADVTIGTSLSGGLDSSAIVAVCERIASGNNSHQCFTASFPGFEKDETSKAAEVARQFGLTQHVVPVNENEIVSLMHQVMQHQEEPFSSGSVLAQFCVYRTAREKGIRVLLDGQGADEVLGGYHKYYKWFWQQLYRNRKLGSSREYNDAKGLGIRETFSIKNRLAALLPEFSTGIWQGRKASKAFHMSDLDRDFAFEQKRFLYHSVPSSYDLNGALYFDTFTYGLEELLRLADRNSMAHGTEVRLPFLGHELVQFLFTLPPHLKIHHGWTKWLLRKSVEKNLPPDITWRKDKVGFEPPQKKWMERADVQEDILMARKKLADKGIISHSTIKKIQPHHSYAAENIDWKIWSASFLYD